MTVPSPRLGLTVLALLIDQYESEWGYG